MIRLPLLIILFLSLIACSNSHLQQEGKTEAQKNQSIIEAKAKETEPEITQENEFVSILLSLFDSEEIVIAAADEEIEYEDTLSSKDTLLTDETCHDIDCSQSTTQFTYYSTEQHALLDQRGTQSYNYKGTQDGNNDLWSRMRKGYALDLSVTDRRIDVQLQWYRKHQRYIDRTTARSSRYLHHIVQEAEKRNMPLEFALLPIVESAFDPFAYSHGRASGLWQFIPGTGKAFGLNQDWWSDERRDVIASTDAALKYLQALANRFDGDWLLALASYNSGGGTVSKAIRYNKKRGLKTDFWSLKLPNETRAYVPKLLALAKLFKEPEKYGITLNSLPDTPYFDIVKVGSQIDLAQAAKLANITVEELYLLNPGFNRWATSPLGPHRLLIPTANTEQFKEGLNSIPKSQRLSWQRYKVRSGDSLSVIAKKFNTTPSVIKQVNNLRSTMIKQNQKLLIPVAAKGETYYAFSSNNRMQKKQSTVPKGKSKSKLEYTVRSGDNLWDISRKYKVGHRSLARWNGMAPTDPLKPGKKLVIWTNSPITLSNVSNAPPSRSQMRNIGYKVRKGDSLARIAGKFNVSIKDIVTWNNINPKKYLKPGQRLKLRIDVTNGS